MALASPAGFYENQDPWQADMELRRKVHRIYPTPMAASGSGRSRWSAIPFPRTASSRTLAEGAEPAAPATAHDFHALDLRPGFKVLISQVFTIPGDPNIDVDPRPGASLRRSWGRRPGMTSRTFQAPTPSPGVRVDYTLRDGAGRSGPAPAARQVEVASGGERRGAGPGRYARRRGGEWACACVGFCMNGKRVRALT